MKRSLLAGVLHALALGVLLAVSVSAAVPGMMSYQGRLTDDTGLPVADSTYSLTFKIYVDSAMSIMPALWTESQDVTTENGLFTVLLGKIIPIPQETFDGSTRYLGITITGGTELHPRTPLVSVPYAVMAGNGSGNVDCSGCDDRFINAAGPDELTATSDTAFKVSNIGPQAHLGILSNVETGSAGQVASVFGVTRTSGDGTSHGGVFDAISTGTGLTYGVTATAENNTTTYAAVGVHGMATNQGSGETYGGYFEAMNGGTGTHIGIHSNAYGTSDRSFLGARAEAVNYGNGNCYGGSYMASSTYGKAYGIHAQAFAECDSAIYGAYSRALNSGTGKAYGGFFEADSGGLTGELTGGHGRALGNNQTTFGLTGLAMNNSGSGYAMGVNGYGENNNGRAYGGYFTAEGANTDCIAVLGYGSEGNNTVQQLMGVCGVTWVTGSGQVSEASYGGKFSSNSANSTQYGVHAVTKNGVGQPQYAVYGLSELVTGGLSSFGMYGRSEHQGTGNSYGGYFLADTTGTGSSYGVRSVGSGFSSAATYGIASYAANRSTGYVYGGFFEIGDFGTGTRYAVYGKSPVSGYAGYFDGHVRITRNMTVVGTKSAAVKTDDDEYRLVYCQESPENWFEDFGEGQLVNGHAHIDLDPVYLKTVTIDDKNPMKVFIQLNDPDCNGTAVIRGTTGFDVVELQNGTGNASFSYRVVAKRRGYENLRLERLPGLTPEQVAAQVEEESATMQVAEDAIERDVSRQKKLDAASERLVESMNRLEIHR